MLPKLLYLREGIHLCMDAILVRESRVLMVISMRNDLAIVDDKGTVTMVHTRVLCDMSRSLPDILDEIGLLHGFFFCSDWRESGRRVAVTNKDYGKSLGLVVV